MPQQRPQQVALAEPGLVKRPCTPGDWLALVSEHDDFCRHAELEPRAAAATAPLTCCAAQACPGRWALIRCASAKPVPRERPQEWAAAAEHHVRAGRRPAAAAGQAAGWVGRDVGEADGSMEALRLV